MAIREGIQRAITKEPQLADVFGFKEFIGPVEVTERLGDSVSTARGTGQQGREAGSDLGNPWRRLPPMTKSSSDLEAVRRQGFRRQWPGHWSTRPCDAGSAWRIPGGDCNLRRSHRAILEAVRRQESRSAVAQALTFKGMTQGQLGESQAEIATYDAVIERFGGSEAPGTSRGGGPGIGLQEPDAGSAWRVRGGDCDLRRSHRAFWRQ